MRRSDRVSRDIDANYFLARRCDVQRKASVKGKAIQGAATRDSSRGQIIFSLIEKRSRLLPAERRNQETHAVLIDFNFRGRFAVQSSGATLESLQFAHAGVVSFDDGPRFEFLD